MIHFCPTFYRTYCTNRFKIATIGIRKTGKQISRRSGSRRTCKEKLSKSSCIGTKGIDIAFKNKVEDNKDDNTGGDIFMKGMEELLGRYKRVRQIDNLYGINIIIIVIIVEYALHLEIIELQTTQKIFKRLKFN